MWAGPSPLNARGESRVRASAQLAAAVAGLDRVAHSCTPPAPPSSFPWLLPGHSIHSSLCLSAPWRRACQLLPLDQSAPNVHGQWMPASRPGPQLEKRRAPAREEGGSRARQTDRGRTLPNLWLRPDAAFRPEDVSGWRGDKGRAAQQASLRVRGKRERSLET